MATQHVRLRRSTLPYSWDMIIHVGGDTVMRTTSWLTIICCVALGLLVMAGTAWAAERPTERVLPAPEVNASAVVWRTPAPPAEPQAGDVWVNPKDEMEMVYIPPGEFTLGTSEAQLAAWLKDHPNDKREWFKGEQPQCRVRLPGYWMGRTEVTDAQYRRFVQATGQGAPGDWEGGQVPSGLERFPVVNVSWEDARAYCAWAGMRLPSELEWEKGARGTDGRVFPWGEAWDSRRCRNLETVSGKQYTSPYQWVADLRGWLDAHDVDREGPAAVGSYPVGASPYGCLDMAGNVWEWCSDWWDEGAYRRYAQGDLTPPKSGTFKVVRGGSWDNVDPGFFRCASHFRIGPADRYFSNGFRCVRGPA